MNPDGLHFTISDTGWGKALWGKLYGQWLCEAATFTYDFDRFRSEEILPLVLHLPCRYLSARFLLNRVR